MSAPKIDPLRLPEIRHVAGDALRANGSMISPNHIIFRFNPRMRTTMGKAIRRNGVLICEFNPHLWQRATCAERVNTVIHETCHILMYVRGLSHVGHGREWQDAMRIAGERPTRTHQVDTTGLSRKVKRYEYKCECRTYYLTKRKILGYVKRRFLTCSTCLTPFVHSVEVPQQ